MGEGKVDAAKTAEKTIDVRSEPVVSLDGKAPSPTSSVIGQNGIAGQTATSGKDGTWFSASSSKDNVAVNLDSKGAQDPARIVVGQVPWPPAEEVEQVQEGFGDLAMPMVAGLVGAALQGNMRKMKS